MPTQSAPREEPDARDVLVHYTHSRYAATGEKRDTWVMFLSACPDTRQAAWPSGLAA